MALKNGLKLILAQAYRCTYTFRNAAGAVYDPTTVTFKYKKPDGTVTTYTYGVGASIVKTSTGIYYIVIITDQAGVFNNRWLGVSTGYSDSDEETVYVADSDVI